MVEKNLPENRSPRPIRLFLPAGRLLWSSPLSRLSGKLAGNSCSSCSCDVVRALTARVLSYISCFRSRRHVAVQIFRYVFANCQELSPHVIEREIRLIAVLGKVFPHRCYLVNICFGLAFGKVFAERKFRTTSRRLRRRNSTGRYFSRNAALRACCWGCRTATHRQLQNRTGERAADMNVKGQSVAVDSNAISP